MKKRFSGNITSQYMIYYRFTILYELKKTFIWNWLVLLWIFFLRPWHFRFRNWFMIWIVIFIILSLIKIILDSLHVVSVRSLLVQIFPKHLPMPLLELFCHFLFLNIGIHFQMHPPFVKVNLHTLLIRFRYFGRVSILHD